MRRKPPTIIAQIRGGLGNQLFCYAAARRLALKNDAALKLDVTSTYTRIGLDGFQREYLLDHFSIQAEHATPYESFSGNIGRLRRRVARFINQRRRFENRNYLFEESQTFDPRMLTLTLDRSIYMTGYWQCERYFKDIERTLRDDLKIVAPFDRETIEVAEKIEAINAVSIHVRSYSELRQKTEGLVLARDYYERAIASMAQRTTNPHFFCFADDPEWAQEIIPGNYPVTYIIHNAVRDGRGAIEDLWLMSQCKHNIIANSTFGWWGAWLNPCTEKIVIAPRQGMPGNPDAIPENWCSM